jgi:glycosyltransferase involved in cell wall biosynthesis
MLKVGVDTSPLYGPSGVRGVGKYVAQLLPALRSTKKVKIVEFKDSFNLRTTDLIHYPYFDFFFLTLPFFKNKKTVVTIHDCTPLVFPEIYPPGMRGKIKFFLQKLSLKTVSAVIADSECSKKDIVQFLGVAKEKIKVIYLAADSDYKKIPQEGRWPAMIRKKYDLGENFLLYVGDVNPNKNLERLLRAFARLPQDYDLVLVGKAFKNLRLSEVRRITALVKELGIKKRVKFPGFVPGSDLAKIYNLAKVFCLPSLYEGFGLSILEAMACGCPVLTGNVSSMPEVAGEAAVLVDPNSEESILDGLKKLTSDSKLCDQLIARGFVQAQKFTWHKTAEETVEVYKQILANEK